MSRSAKITRFFGNADYPFALAIEQLEELQEEFDCGLQNTIEHIAAVRVKDIYAVLRLGLIGGGMEKQAAYRLVIRHVVPGELGSCAVLAVEVVNAAIAGVADERLGEGKGERTETHSPEEKSDSPSSTAPGRSSATRRRKSADARSGSSARPSKGGPKPTAAATSPRSRRQSSTTKT